MGCPACTADLEALTARLIALAAIEAEVRAQRAAIRDAIDAVLDRGH